MYSAVWICQHRALSTFLCSVVMLLESAFCRSKQSHSVQLPFSHVYSLSLSLSLTMIKKKKKKKEVVDVDEEVGDLTPTEAGLIEPARKPCRPLWLVRVRCLSWSGRG